MTMAAPPFRVQALYEYSSKEEDDLNFPNGQIITVTDVEDNDWYFGEFADAAGTKQEGLFPKNFVKIFEPETPPRPSRTSKSRKELEPLAPPHDEQKNIDVENVEGSSPPTLADAEQAGSQPQPPLLQQQARQQHKEAASHQEAHLQDPMVDPVPPAPAEKPAAKPIPPPATKPAPPSAGDKPVSGSFRDRINAFNKPAAPPVAPTKPTALGSSGGSGFVKKPFVAPPPSKNAYVPPPREQPSQKIYRREEDPDVIAESARAAENDQSNQPQAASSVQEEEDQPKPTSLKERIALLQKQQMEQAARRADTGQKKDKPKAPPKTRVEPEVQVGDRADDVEGEPLDRMNSSETAGNRSMESTRDPPPPISRSNTRPNRSREITPVGSPVAAPSRDLLSDPNDADQSGLGDTEEGEEFSTGHDDSDERASRQASIPLPQPSQAPVREADVGDEEDNAEEDVEEEEDVDPELKRRMEIRERMAKMSGGMGMAGMFGPSGGLPSKSSTKQVPGSSDRKASSNSASGQIHSPTSRAPPISMMPMPGLQKVRSPDQDESQPEVRKEDEGVQKSVLHGRGPEEMPDVEDMKEEPVLPSRRSTERSAPPPVPQGNPATTPKRGSQYLLTVTDRPVPAPPVQGRGLPPPIPAERPVPTSASECV